MTFKIFCPSVLPRGSFIEKERRVENGEKGSAGGRREDLSPVPSLFVSARARKRPLRILPRNICDSETEKKIYSLP